MSAGERIRRTLHLVALLLLCSILGMALFRVLGLLIDGQEHLPPVLFHGIPLTLLPAVSPDFGVLQLTTGLVLRINLGLVPGLLAGWFIHRRYFTPAGKKKRRTPVKRHRTA